MRDNYYLAHLTKTEVKRIPQMNKQTGFTLIELAIVLVIIGLLLGGVLRGQELINSAKVKNMARDFQNVQVYIYGYQDKFKALPGDDSNAVSHLGATANQSATGAGNGVIGGNWNSTTATDESAIFWQHVRLAGLAPGATVIAAGPYYPTNADGGRIGVQSVSTFAGTITGMSGAYVVCSDAILGKFAKQLDTTLDDGVGDTGSVRIQLNPPAAASAGVAAPADATNYMVCMAF
jgi:prepilin-type N-terminal cleavage/methylation domain-containing protein